MSEKNGQNKCPSCGATEISFDEKSGKLRCEYCKYIFAIQKANRKDSRKIKGVYISEGASDIEHGEDIITLRCSSCGADVVINTSEKLQAKCHWCRSVLSINEKVPNGAVPDVILPFSIKRKEAKESIRVFIDMRKKYANKKFIRQFNEEDIIGVYLPYMLVDVRANVLMRGIGEKTGKKHAIISFFLCNKNDPEYYSVDVFDIKREFKMDIEGLTIESNEDRGNVLLDRTNNIVNSIMPFDTNKAVKWNASYLKGYNAEKRDLNVGNLENVINRQSKDIIRMSMKKTLKEYDRGVCWKKEEMKVNAQKWESAYLPVWLYSYTEKKIWGNKTHYIAVNGRTREVTGSMPMNMPLYIFKVLLPHIITWGITACIYNGIEEDGMIGACIMFSGIVAFLQYIIGAIGGETIEKYSNRSARHDYENETDYKVKELKKDDRFRWRKYFCKDRPMLGANHTKLKGNRFGRVRDKE